MDSQSDTPFYSNVRTHPNRKPHSRAAMSRGGVIARWFVELGRSDLPAASREGGRDLVRVIEGAFLVTTINVIVSIKREHKGVNEVSEQAYVWSEQAHVWSERAQQV